MLQTCVLKVYEGVHVAMANLPYMAIQLQGVKSTIIIIRAVTFTHQKSTYTVQWTMKYI